MRRSSHPISTSRVASAAPVSGPLCPGNFTPLLVRSPPSEAAIKGRLHPVREDDLNSSCPCSGRQQGTTFARAAQGAFFQRGCPEFWITDRVWEAGDLIGLPGAAMYAV